MIAYTLEDTPCHDEWLRVAYQGKSLAFPSTQFRARRTTARVALTALWVAVHSPLTLLESRAAALALGSIEVLRELGDAGEEAQAELDVLLKGIKRE